MCLVTIHLLKDHESHYIVNLTSDVAIKTILRNPPSGPMTIGMVPKYGPLCHIRRRFRARHVDENLTVEDGHKKVTGKIGVTGMLGHISGN